jgi:hypothetical protein
MATLRDYFDNDVARLTAFRDKYGIREMIETGTGDGESIAFAKEGIQRIYSFEINTQIFEVAYNRFVRNKNIRIYNVESVFGMKKVFNYYNFRDPILFFLDAHFPGADFGYAGYEDEKDKSLRLPLQSELELIVKARGDDIKKDVFIIDDLRIYEDGPFEAGPWELKEQLGGQGIEFVYDLFAETHYIEKDYRFQGFLLLTPMK